MAASDKYSELIISDTLIPDIFIARYLPMLGKDAVMLYLWTKMVYKGDSFSLKDALSYGAIPEADIKTALAELVTAGILVSSKNDRFDPVDLKLIEIDEYINSKTDEDGTPVLRSDEKTRNLLSASVNKTYYQGLMGFPFYKLIDKCLYDYHFNDSVVYALFEEGKERRIQYVVPKMFDLAKRWYEKGITTEESLKDYYEMKQRRSALEKLLGKMLRRRLNELDYEHINTWADVYGADAEIVEYAIRVNDWKGAIRTVDIESKLKEWFDAGVMTIDKATVYEAERHKENKEKAQRNRGRTNVRKTGKEAGISMPSAEETDASKKNAEESEPPVHDSILELFGDIEDEDDN